MGVRAADFPSASLPLLFRCEEAATASVRRLVVAFP